MPARPSRKPRNADHENQKGVERGADNGKVNSDGSFSPKMKRQFAAVKQQAGSARGR